MPTDTLLHDHEGPPLTEAEVQELLSVDVIKELSSPRYRATMTDLEFDDWLFGNRHLLGSRGGYITKAAGGATVHKDRAGAISLMGDGRVMRVVFSDNSVDRTGDQVIQAGCQLGLFLKNPVALLYHNPELPYGSVSDIRLDALGSTCLITAPPPGIGYIDDAWAMVQAQVLRSVSIGMDPTEVEPMDPARPRGPVRYKRWTLCEISLVTIPANTNAEIIQVSNAKGARAANLPISDRAARMQRAAELIAKGGRMDQAWERAKKGWPTAAERAAYAPHPVDSMTPQERRAYVARRVASGAPPSLATGNLPQAEVQAVAAAKHAAGVYAERQEMNPDRSNRVIRAGLADRKSREVGRG